MQDLDWAELRSNLGDQGACGVRVGEISGERLGLDPLFAQGGDAAREALRIARDRRNTITLLAEATRHRVRDPHAISANYDGVGHAEELARAVRHGAPTFSRSSLPRELVAQPRGQLAGARRA